MILPEFTINTSTAEEWGSRNSLAGVDPAILSCMASISLGEGTSSCSASKRRLSDAYDEDAEEGPHP